MEDPIKIYDKLRWDISNFQLEEESKEYAACKFMIGNLSIISRIAKVTPTKIGSFVTFWKRENNGPIMPYHISDNFDFLIVNIVSQNNKGIFIFPKSALLQHNIISGSSEGKRAFRIYTPWDKPISKQGVKSKKWQIEYFSEMDNEEKISLLLKNYSK